MNHDRHDPPPIAADDPRLSEWLDGRLTAAEAAEVERLVAASPELTKLVADLRGMRGVLGAVPVTPPPAGFVRDVLAAIDAAGDEAEVEEEWRRIERQRLEEEIAEARDDAAEPVREPMRQRWPWLALAGALAAGVIVAVVINRQPLPGDREVALGERRPSERSRAELAEQRATKRAASVDADRSLEEAAGDDGEQAPAAEDLAERADGDRDDPPSRPLEGAKKLDRAAADEARAVAGLAGKPGAGGYGGGGGGPGAATKDARSLQAAAAPPAAAAPHGEALGRQAHEAAQSQAAALAVSPDRVVRYRIRTAADRARLDELVAASDTLAAARGRLVDAETLRKAEAEQDAAVDKLARSRRGREGGPVVERIEVSGPAAEIAALVAALEAAAPPAKGGDGQTAQGAAERKDLPVAPGAPAPNAGGVVLKNVPGEPEPAGKARPEVVRLVIEVVDESGADAAEGGP